MYGPASAAVWLSCTHPHSSPPPSPPPSSRTTPTPPASIAPAAAAGSAAAAAVLPASSCRVGGSFPRPPTEHLARGCAGGHNGRSAAPRLFTHVRRPRGRARRSRRRARPRGGGRSRVHVRRRRVRGRQEPARRRARGPRAHAGARVFVGHCLELGGAAIPYAPLVDALRPIARELVECGSTSPRRSAGRARALAELMPEFRAPGPGADGDGAHQARVFEALLALIERLGRVQPVVLVLEDLHWADQSTRDFLTFLVRSARDGAALARRHLPLRRAAPPPPAAPAAGRARAHAGRRPARAGALQPRRAGRADLRRSSTRRPRRPRRPAVRAQRGQPALHRGAARRVLRRLPGAARDAARPARRARRAALRPPRRSCAWSVVEHPMRHALLAALSRPRRRRAAGRRCARRSPTRCS